MSLTFVSGKDNSILLDIGQNMEKLDGQEKMFYEDKKRPKTRTFKWGNWHRIWISKGN